MVRPFLLALLAFMVTCAATAQQPLTPPVYYLSSLPKLTQGATISGELTSTDGQSFKDGSRVDMVLFYLQAGETARLDLHSDDFDTYLAVFDPDGFLYDYNDDDYDGMDTDSALSVTSDVAGRYLAVISGVSSYDLGAYTLSWGSGGTTGPADTTPLSVPGTLSASLDGASEARLGQGFSGPARWYTFTLNDAFFVDINMHSDDVDSALVLLDEDGNTLAVNDDGGNFGSVDARVTELLDAGTYVLGVGGYQPGTGGAYDLDVQLYLPLE